jgi:hypothetical protein
MEFWQPKMLGKPALRFILIVPLKEGKGLMNLPLIGAFVTTLFCCQTLPKVEVPLRRPIDRIKGKSWPKIDDVPASISGVDDPCDLTITFPSSLSLRSRSNTVFLSQTKGMIREVDVTPFLRVVPYLKAVEEVEAIGKRLKIETKDSFKKIIEQWKKAQPKGENPSNRYGKVTVEEGISLRLEVRYHRQQQGWDVLLEFTVPSLFGLPDPK